MKYHEVAQESNNVFLGEGFMKTYIMITKVKNEADIIEFFLRYHANIFDYIIVIDNGSIDGTYEIVNELIKEGLPIEIINEAYSDFDAFRFVNQYTKMLALKYNADQIAFMDADEFLLCDDGSNPRKILDELCSNKVHYFYWKTYLYSEDREIFSFEHYSEYRDEKYETFTKIIIPGAIVRDNDIVIEAGNHRCHMLNKDVDVLKEEYHLDLKFCHFPIRSSIQYKKQILLNLIDMIGNPMSQNLTGNHWRILYKNNNTDRLNLRDISLHYAFYDQCNSVCETIKSCFNVEVVCADLIENNLEKILLKHAELKALQIKQLKLENIDNVKNKKKIIIWGTGEQAKKTIKKIPLCYEIQAYIDSDEQKEFDVFDGKVVVTPPNIRFIDFDLIVIATDKYESEIRQQINSLIPFWSDKEIVSIENLLIESFKLQMKERN